MSFFSDVLGVLLFPIRLLGDLIGDLIPIPEAPAVLKDGGQALKADFRTNDAQIGDVRQVAYGYTTVWAQNASEPWNSYDGLNEIRHALVHISVGAFIPDAIRLENTPIGNLAGSRAEVYQPGERATLFHPNVYTSPDARDIELQGGALSEISATLPLEFSGGRISFINSDPTLYAVPIGASITIAGTASNNGSYTVTNVGIEGRPGAWRKSWVDVAASFTTESAPAATLSYSQDNTGAQTVKSEQLEFTFNSALSQVTGPAGAEYEDCLADFRIGDLVGAFDGVSTNANRAWRVVDVLGGNGLVLAGDPVSDETVTCRLILKRRRVGGYVACPPGATVNEIGLHFFFRALYHAAGDTIGNRSVSFEVRWRPVDDAGTPIGDWTSQLVTVVAATAGPWRETKYVDISPACRAEIDVCRVTQETDNSQVQDAATLGGLLGFIVNLPGDDPAVDNDCTRAMIQVRSSGQLARLAENAVNLDGQSLRPVWQGSELGWSAPQATSSPAWLTADWLTAMSAGTISYDDLELDTFLECAEAWAASGDRFDGVIDKAPTLLDGANTILACGRAKLIRDQQTGKYSIFRDAATPPVLLLADAINVTLGEEGIDTPSSNSVTGTKVTFFDPLLRESREGPVVGLDTDPETVQMLGLKSWQKAHEQAFFLHRRDKLRVRSQTGDAEMEGLQLRYGARVMLASSAQRYGQATTLLSADGLVMQVWPAPFWVAGAQHYVYLSGRDGVPGARINCSRGLADDMLVLASAIDVTLREPDDTAPMAIAFGHDGTETVPADGPVIALVTGMVPQPVTTPDGTEVVGMGASLSLLIDDERIHADPGEAPPDSKGGSAVVPVLAIAGLVLTEDGGSISASWDAVVLSDAVPIYETAWRYKGSLDWTVVRRGEATAAEFTVTDAGVVQVRVRGLAAGRLIREAVDSVTVTAGGGTLTATSAPASVYGISSTSPVTSSVSYLEIRGGTPPYTVTTEHVSGDTAAVVAVGDSGVRFSSSIPAGASRAGVYRRRVEDSLGAVTYSNDVDFTLERTGSSGGGSIP